MSENFKRYCYDILPCLKVHSTFGYTEKRLKHYHYDTNFIIDYFKKNSGSIVIQGSIYKLSEGDVIILNPDQLHLCQIDENKQGERISIHIGKEILDGFECDANEFFRVFYGHGNIIPCALVKKMGIDSVIEKITEFSQKNDKSSAVLARCKTLELVSLIEKAMEAYRPIQEDCVENTKLQDILYYINHNYREDITLATVSEKFYYSKYHICMLFKTRIGMSVTDYITLRRIHYINDLINKGVPIAQASTMGGFHNYSNFYRLYKKHMNITPLEYKQKIKQEKMV